MKVLIVESPAKAKTINQYLGSDYKVISSYGHVRGLPSEEGSVDTEKGFAMHYTVLPKSQKQVAEIVRTASKADSIILATDPDREGEAISWHIYELLKEKKAMVREITKSVLVRAKLGLLSESPKQKQNGSRNW
jgi:DNA topoisomerase-1